MRDEYPILRQNKVHQPTPIEGVVSLSGMHACPAILALVVEFVALMVDMEKYRGMEGQG